MNKNFFDRLRNRLSLLFKQLVRPLVQTKANKKHLSGQGIALACDLCITDRNFEDITSIKAAYSIFVNSEDVERFLFKYQDELKGKVVLAGNSDTNFPKYLPEMRFPKELYLQNLGFPARENVKLLPIGLENYEHVRSGFAFFHREPKKFAIRDKILVPPMSATNPMRSYVLSNVDKFPIFRKESRYLNVFKYFRLVRKYEYVFVCEGNGYDTHRLWEVLYQGSKPVVFRSDFTSNLMQLGLPILAIDDLSELSIESLDHHRQAYIDYRKETVDLLWLKYWKSEILVRTKSEN